MKQFLLLIGLLVVLGACKEQAPAHVPVGMQYIAEGSYLRTVGLHEQEELELEGFLLDQHPVTVAAFRAFIQETGYKTDAERFGEVGVFDPEKKASSGQTCDSTFCHNYQIDGRTSSSRETALFRTGFRCAKSI